MGYWVYFARCSNNTIYTGATTDLTRRMREHNEGSLAGNGAKYTAAHRPVCLAQAWKVDTWSNALRLEYALKKCLRKDKDQLIKQPGCICQIAERCKFDFSITQVSQELLQNIL